ncbi:MAG: hypothetical protein ACLQVF_11650, partial [Isosphaeraceae bacterium]
GGSDRLPSGLGTSADLVCGEVARDRQSSPARRFPCLSSRSRRRPSHLVVVAIHQIAKPRYTAPAMIQRTVRTTNR